MAIADGDRGETRGCCDPGDRAVRSSRTVGNGDVWGFHEVKSKQNDRVDGCIPQPCIHYHFLQEWQFPVVLHSSHHGPNLRVRRHEEGVPGA